MSLVVTGLTISVDKKPILRSLDFALAPTGDRLFVRGPSGCGKTLLLRCIAGLDRLQTGSVMLGGQSPAAIGWPLWRVHVLYVLQSRVQLKGTPADFYLECQQLKAQRGRARGDLPALIHDLGLEQTILNQAWTTLSGGQAQRVMLALALALRPSVLLLDEPTSACDPVSTRRVEAAIARSGISCVWVSHDAEQPGRVGGRLLELPAATIFVLPPPDVDDQDDGPQNALMDGPHDNHTPPENQAMHQLP
mmetsp:Transcript_9209/g.16187  ORF Transcript_9209/g.16187 Transcript_9209/m.16187 type:complete len:249 (+) Transcript_9209:146-892(+)|eukprot:CAMPEP_0119101734 /NCGR_PEP_ID=MMETSP1180-20130426/704_1 /TAXON_ID=3052 ORGANISM="Chlamydomonas cf sp, Strain CCMP681" /NCGR_SAMPLE_ID=MMETSP1180 /ASSEMBLY_ACC=CAM_ASM_000741 /LENGTH=248 /DNA_ID=CAMNT_0007085901 /DNA_START=145 /DNA_END=891 /DNA_ORIENTATION=-